MTKKSSSPAQLNLFTKKPETPAEKIRVEGLADSALTSFHPGAKDSGGIKRRLSSLRALGHPIEPYAKMKFLQLSNYLARLGREIRPMAQTICPDKLTAIDMGNERFAADCRAGAYA